VFFPLKDCPNGASSRGTSDGRECYNCGDAGHLSRDCDQPSKGKSHSLSYGVAPPRRSREGGFKRCYNCGKDGHISRGRFYLFVLFFTFLIKS
jgi:hypothetical protein